jgi:hypothetical protein
MLCQFRQIGLEWSQISQNSRAVVFNCFSKAIWELQTGFLTPHGSNRRFFKKTLSRLRKKLLGTG